MTWWKRLWLIAVEYVYELAVISLLALILLGFSLFSAALLFLSFQLLRFGF